MRELQIRQTYEDTKAKQEELFKLIRRKIRTNSGLSIQEKYYFPSLVSDALLSTAWIHVYFDTPDNRKIDLGSVRFFALNLVDVSGHYVYVYDRNIDKRYKVSMSELWTVFYYKVKELSQLALDEAIHMSKELPKREKGEAKVFSAEESL